MSIEKDLQIKLEKIQTLVDTFDEKSLEKLNLEISKMQKSFFKILEIFNNFTLEDERLLEFQYNLLQHVQHEIKARSITPEEALEKLNLVMRIEISLEDVKTLANISSSSKDIYDEDKDSNRNGVAAILAKWYGISPRSIYDLVKKFRQTNATNPEKFKIDSPVIFSSSHDSIKEYLIHHCF